MVRGRGLESLQKLGQLDNFTKHSKRKILIHVSLVLPDVTKATTLNIKLSNNRSSSLSISTLKFFHTKYHFVLVT